MLPRRLLPWLLVIGPLVGWAQERFIPAHLAREDTPFYEDYRPRNFPFIETTLDLREAAPKGTTTNLVPRALVLSLGDDVYVGFDTELLRVAAIWEGDFITPDGMAMLSYAVPLRKLGGGQSQLPKPQGQIRFATDLYPGWQHETPLVFSDPRPRGPDPRELGRGPLAESQGHWQAIDDEIDRARLHYTLGQTHVVETITLADHDSRHVVLRSLEIGPLDRAIYGVVAELDEPADRVPDYLSAQGAALSLQDKRFVVANISPSPDDQRVTLAYALDQLPVPQDVAPLPPRSDLETNRSAATTVTRMIAGKPQGAYAVDELLVPYPNAWERRIRPMDLAFYPNGEAVMVSYDGDVFRVEGLNTLDTDTVHMRRIASGFNEPQSIVLRGDDIFVFSRLGITRLHDLDGDGDTDRYEMFCNDFVQSAETRAFPLSLVALNDGSLLFTVGGQQELYPTAHAGRVMQVSAEGEFLGIYAEGLRNGYLSKIGSDDRIVATDQQGNWVPATPMHHIEAGKFYGYVPGTTHPREVANVPVWVPHRFAQSAIGMIGIQDPRHGGMDGSVMMLDYFKPGLLKILGGFETPLIQAVAIPVPVEVAVPIIKGALNPADGQTYHAGMQIWSSNAPRIEGLSRLRTLKPTDDLPTAAQVYTEGVWLRFAEPLDPTTMIDPSSYSVMSWSYRRTESYGSGQYRASGQPGIDPHPIHSVWLSPDRREVFLAVPQLPVVTQLEVKYLRPDGEWQECLFTINELSVMPETRRNPFDFPSFEQLFASAPAPRSAPDPMPTVSVERGLQVATQYGCIACHSLDGSTEGRTGPSWKGIYQTRRPLEDRRPRTANSNYLRDSIMEPNKNMVKGYGGEDVAMPSYEGVLTPDQVDSIIMLIESIGPDAAN